MRMADYQLVQITGIQQADGSNTAEVEFYWRYANVTPFGEIASEYSDNLDYSQGNRRQTVLLTRFDDGWRLPNDWSPLVQKGELRD